ncbi:hypothetical protein C8N46_1139 [Kordia periserrulae]|uniref:Uncharacterized protein n=1 Tax=Kordia periserrulae TaxID=701523 RepID=A0A2T6BR39_9FLAO|nr:hypothetical protein [Kordia periserrulae]PTX58519.1 hypothetical protein C8N46_1139 [Kordia periserrulae]
MSIVESSFDFVKSMTDKSKPLRTRLIIIFSLLTLVLIFELGFKTSYNIHLNNKLSQLEKLQDLKKDFSNDPVKMKSIYVLENEVIGRKHYLDYFRTNEFKKYTNAEIFLFLEKTNKRIDSLNRIINSLDVDSLSKYLKYEHSNIVIKSVSNDNSNDLSLFWTFISFSYLTLAFFAGLIFAPLFDKDLKLKDYFFGLIFYLIFFTGITFILVLVGSLIPVINNNPLINYFIYGSVHLVLSLLIVYLIRGRIF